MFIPVDTLGRINSAPMTPGQKFTLSLTDAGLIPAQFARLMDVDSQDINNWKHRGLPKQQLFKAAKFLGKDPQWLLLDDTDLPNDFTPEQVAQEDHAMALFDSLTDSQRGLVGSLIDEFVRK